MRRANTTKPAAPAWEVAVKNVLELAMLVLAMYIGYNIGQQSERHRLDSLMVEWSAGLNDGIGLAIRTCAEEKLGILD